MRLASIFRALLPATLRQPDEVALSFIDNHKCTNKPLTVERFVVIDLIHLPLSPSADFSTWLSSDSQIRQAFDG
jgi:hypothetical protein